ncbi:MAG: RIP metalloprotease RseP [Candidatus Paceibacterota bacterium]|jgi:regulator of sigma E protease
MNVVLVIVLLSLLILVHEMGHFFSAKKVGIRVDEFGIGYPPRLVGVYKGKDKKWRLIGFWQKKKEIEGLYTVYSINLIPFGGFVKIFGENRDINKKTKINKKSFEAQGAIKRSLVVLSGVFANLLFAILLLSIMFSIGAPVVMDEGQKVVARNEGVVISEVLKGSPAESVGLQMGDKISKIKTKDESIEIKEVEQVQKTIEDHRGENVIITIIRNNNYLDIVITPRTEYPEGEGPTGVTLFKTGIVSYPWYEAIWKSIVYSFKLLGMMAIGFFTIIKDIILEGRVTTQVVGPVGIFKLTSQAAHLGIVYLLHFGAIISLNLMILNAFPFPALDGGKFLFIIIEKIKGSPINAKTERIANSIGFSLLILLMIVITAKDIAKLF